MNLIPQRVRAAFSWARSSAIAAAMGLHAAALLLVLAPMTPPQAREVIKAPSFTIDVVIPTPPVVQPIPPPQEPPRLRAVRQPDPTPAPTPLPVAVPDTVAETSVMTAPPNPPTQAPADSTAVEVPPSTSIQYGGHAKLIYPRQAIRQRHEGQVILLVLVGLDGSPKEVKIDRSSGYRELDQAAVAAVRTWRFHPGRRGAVAIEAWARVPIDYRLNGAL